MQKPWYNRRTTPEEVASKRYKMTLEAILEFIQLMPDDAFQKLDKPNFTTEDFTLKQFHWRVAKKIEEFNLIHQRGRGE